MSPGMGITRPASATAFSAKPPQPMLPSTRSPGLNAVTPSPTASTMPATSPPGENGSSGTNWYFFSMMSVSGKFTPAAFTSMSTWPGPGTGSATSSTTSVPGGPHALQSTALMLSP